MSKSKIEWTDRTWNPVTGCTKVSLGCANCYAERMAKRLRGRCGYNNIEPFNVTLHYDRLDTPFTWRKPCKVFVCSMGDLFHDQVDSSFIYSVFEVLAALSQHIFIVLTKRPERMRQFIIQHSEFHNLPNIWLGVSAENQQTADERIPILLQIPAAVRFVSCEPLMGPVDLTNIKWHTNENGSNHVINALTGFHGAAKPVYDMGLKIDWVIAGGESGPGARPMHPDWARLLRDQCQDAGVPFFFKQWGEFASYGHGNLKNSSLETQSDCKDMMVPVGKKAAGRLLDGREWNEFPNLTTKY